MVPLSKCLLLLLLFVGCTSANEIKWRADGKCDNKTAPYDNNLISNIGPHGGVAECDPNSDKPCCSSWGNCGLGPWKPRSNNYEYCTCRTCTDYRPLKTVHGGWSQWTEWSICSPACQQKRQRTCTSPTPQNGGRDCSGDHMMRQSCTGGNCRKTTLTTEAASLTEPTLLQLGGNGAVLVAVIVGLILIMVIVAMAICCYYKAKRDKRNNKPNNLPNELQLPTGQFELNHASNLYRTDPPVSTNTVGNHYDYPKPLLVVEHEVTYAHFQPPSQGMHNSSHNQRKYIVYDIPRPPLAVTSLSSFNEEETNTHGTPDPSTRRTSKAVTNFSTIYGNDSNIYDTPLGLPLASSFGPPSESIVSHYSTPCFPSQPITVIHRSTH